MKSTLVEPPPDFDERDEEGVEFIRADSVGELAKQTNIGDEEVLDRVLLPGKRFGAYEIMGFVAAGGMGEIYAARRIKSDGSKSRPVALKVITAEYANDWRIIERFKREARISKAIRSGHVARVYEFGESPSGHVFMSMELLNGEELFDRLHRHRILSPMTVADLMLQTLKGLHKIHDSGFVHRDIKPENIFLAGGSSGDEETVKIIDFGIAKRAADESDPLLSVAGQIYGTPQYIAPEQAVNPDVDHRADIYSLGVVMYECVTGCLPFEGESSYDTIVAHQNEEVPSLPSSVDPEFAQIIYHALAKDPDQRFQSAVEMGRVLKKWRDETSWVEEVEPSLSEELESAAGAADHSATEVDEAPSGEQISSEFMTPDEIDDLSDEPSTPDAEPANASPPDPQPRPASPPDESLPDSGPDAGDEIAPPPETTTELRSPRIPDPDKEVSETDTRNAQIITGIALGVLILAILSLLMF